MVAPHSNSGPLNPANPAENGSNSGPPPTQYPRTQDPGPSAALSDRDNALLNALLASNFDLPKTAAEYGLSTTELVAWINTPRIQSTAATLLSTSQLLLEIKLTRARMAVIDTLQEIALHHESLTERRRAATALCRRLGAGSLLDRTGVRPIPNPPSFTDARPWSPIQSESVLNPRESSVLSPEVLSHSTHPSSLPTQDPGLHDSGLLSSPLNRPVLSPQHSVPLPTQDPGPQDSGPSPQLSPPSFRPHALSIPDDCGGNHVVLPWPMPETRDPDPPTRLALRLFNAFANRDLDCLIATFEDSVTDEATLDGKPLALALPRHTLALMYHSREVAYVERSRGPNEATYTFSFERAPLSPARASFRFHLTRAQGDSWLIHQIDTLDTS